MDNKPHRKDNKKEGQLSRPRRLAERRGKGGVYLSVVVMAILPVGASALLAYGVFCRLFVVIQPMLVLEGDLDWMEAGRFGLSNKKRRIPNPNPQNEGKGASPLIPILTVYPNQEPG